LITWLKSLLRKLRPAAAGGRADASWGAVDPDLGEIFVAELAEVAQALSAAFAAWHANPGDRDALVRMRRGFHTLKGSAPLIGSTALGEFCAQSERLTTRLIEMPAKATPEVIRIVEQAVAVLPAFAESMRDSRAPPPLRTITERVRRLSA
jgi:chemosensory pili system protein ChpA (sensor histidine kinase/response regulator)